MYCISAFERLQRNTSQEITCFVHVPTQLVTDAIIAGYCSIYFTYSLPIIFFFYCYKISNKKHTTGSSKKMDGI